MLPRFETWAKTLVDAMAHARDEGGAIEPLPHACDLHHLHGLDLGLDAIQARAGRLAEGLRERLRAMPGAADRVTFGLRDLGAALVPGNTVRVEAAAAHRVSEARHLRGKLVFEVR